MKVTYNYHTHTYRCRHAVGEDREYVETAIQGGYQILGFSDHCPWVFPDHFVSGMRMSPGEVDGYFQSLEALKHEYRNDIQIFIGFESEYIPELMEKQEELCSGYPLDYMILGQHFLGPENTSAYLGMPTRDEAVLKSYADHIIEGIKTGKYLYVAHPDLVHYIGPDAIYEKHMSRLCSFLRDADIPVEINLLGATDGRHYPSDRFFRIAQKNGNTCIIGADAHAPSGLLNAYGEQLADRLIQKYSLPLAVPPLSKPAPS